MTDRPNENMISSGILKSLWKLLGLRNRSQYLRFYLDAIMRVRRFTLLLLLILLLPTLASAGVLLLLAALYLAPWDASLKMWVALIAGGTILFSMISCIALLFSQHRWLRFFKADEMIRSEVQNGK